MDEIKDIYPDKSNTLSPEAVERFNRAFDKYIFNREDS